MEFEECVICFEAFKNTDNITHLSCHHKFHKNCINKWYNIKQICPICRTPQCQLITFKTIIVTIILSLAWIGFLLLVLWATKDMETPEISRKKADYEAIINDNECCEIKMRLCLLESGCINKLHQVVRDRCLNVISTIGCCNMRPGLCKNGIPCTPYCSSYY